ncbi:MAG: hypothetical protein HZA11_04495 [Nitrospirae bacterium]|nr:hypothetical protein [Nitrospirota bacterium]
MDKWKKWIEGKVGLPLGDLVNVVVLIVSLLALIISGISLKVALDSLKVSIDSLKSTEKAGDAQQKVLEASRKSLEAVVDKMNTQTQLLLQQYKETLLKPKVKVYFWNFKDKVELHPDVYDAKSQTRRGGQSAPPIQLKSDADGRAFFDVYIENVGDRDLVQANVSVSCNVPIETYSLGETGRSGPAPADPHSGDWTIHFTKMLLNPFKQSESGLQYKFSTKGPFPNVWLPRKLFGCFVFLRAPGMAPFVSGGFLEVVDKQE